MPACGPASHSLSPHGLPQVVRRGAAPLGGGEVLVRLPVVRQLAPVSATDEGMVKRIRGVAFSTRVSPQCSNRMVDGARGVLNDVRPAPLPLPPPPPPLLPPVTLLRLLPVLSLPPLLHGGGNGGIGLGPWQMRPAWAGRQCMGCVRLRAQLLPP